MKLGERLKAARLEKGFTQQQLCGNTITRNMLSQIENGTASPSIQTLTELAGRLGKPMSYFLDESPIFSPNWSVMERARAALKSGTDLLEILTGYAAPDDIFDPEYRLLYWTGLLQAAQKVLREGQTVYARELLEKAEILEAQVPLCFLPELSRRRIMLEARIASSAVSELPSQDEELMLRAEFTVDNFRKGALLDACEDHSTPKWNLLRGVCYTAVGEWTRGAECLHQAEEIYPAETAPMLEQCCRELGDYRGAYLYACRQRSDGK